MSRLKIGAAVSIVAALLASCGGKAFDGDDDVCAPFAACGGDPVGEWEIEGYCFEDGQTAEQLVQEDAFNDPACEGAVRRADISVTGSFDIKDDETSSGTVFTTTDLDIRLTQPCYRALSDEPDAELSGFVCDLFAAFITQSDFFDSMQCSFANGACDCRGTGSTSEPVSGTYSVNGNVFETPGGDSEFCVRDDVLRFKDEDGTVLQLRRL